MGFHDGVALKAMRDGRTSSEFHIAAQKKANAAWFWIISTAAVWYLEGLSWALLPGIVAIFTSFQSISATLIATRLEKMQSEQNS